VVKSSIVAGTGIQDDRSALAAFCNSLSETSRSIVVEADRLIRSLNPAVLQILWGHQRTIGYGIGPKKMSEHYCYLDVYDQHVNLEFNHGVALPDPEHLLKGSGARFRSLRLDSAADLDHPGLRTLLLAAAEERQKAVQFRS